MIQDSSFIIDLLRGDEDAKQFLDIIEKEARPQKVSSVTVLELYEGVSRSQTPDTKRDRILEILETKHVVSADHTVMRKAGKLSGGLINDGERIEREDCIIAATALLNDEPVITRNTKHFGRIDSLEVRSY
ncbi:type II toxin-antitoxin system VapC family toxin [Natronolimnohabitans innermongolicus]|uniref:Twitching motility protein PilT n=1 Tax=Natronolimnohabitans innermongolicus JCM 12255 TaxID=1227499 RepID=L9WHB6_9EURY|nr:type II toxin-antitoxin system VapC family toxin [Natronolimnohabitans innermongolicus]ELY48900.1 twitching motility protein PilT [Natronolimnohabitans innermongolicus JCM 12255]